LSWDSSGVHQLLSAPPLYFIGGVIGAFFVALTSWIIPYLGIMKTTVLLISGQMLMGTAIDFYAGNTDHLGSALLGLFLIIMGTLLGARAKTV